MQKLIVIKYGQNNAYDCIACHKNVIDELGFCGFGKIGKAPNLDKINCELSK